MLQGGKLWYRGGIYKLIQLLALFLSTAAWLAVAVPVTTNGIEANKSYNSHEEYKASW